MKLKELLPIVTDEHAIYVRIRKDGMIENRIGFKNVLSLTTFDLNKTVTEITTHHGTLIIVAE